MSKPIIVSKDERDIQPSEVLGQHSWSRDVKVGHTSIKGGSCLRGCTDELTRALSAMQLSEIIEILPNESLRVIIPSTSLQHYFLLCADELGGIEHYVLAMENTVVFIYVGNNCRSARKFKIAWNA